MYFSTIRLRHDISPKEMVKLTEMNGYQVHQLVWRLFADHPDRRRDFIYRHEPIRGWPSFCAVSGRKPLDDLGLWEIRTREYNPRLQAGQRLGFSLRVNPIRARRDENGKQRRHDVVMEEKIKLRSVGKEIDLPEIVQKQGCLWLEKRSASQGFHVSASEVKVSAYRQQKFHKGKGNALIAFSTLDFDGILTVSDPDIFVKESLFAGIGPTKSFGCGLMLTRRP